MRRFFSYTSDWTYVFLVMCLAPLAACLATAWGWSGGAACLALLAIPVCHAALFTGRWVALATSLLAGAACFAEAWYVQSLSMHPVIWAFPGLAACMLFGLCLLVRAASMSRKCEVRRLHDPNTRHVQELSHGTRKGPPTGSCPDLDAVPPKSTSQEAVNFPMLLLALQDIGRRISTNLDFETLVPTIISTARVSLKCGRCQLFFWNPPQQTLTNALPQEARDRNAYVPHPSRGMGGWVVEHRQILTRRDIEDDASLCSLLKHEPEPPAAVAPLAVGGELLGLLVVDKVVDDSLNFVRLLYILANISALGIKNAQLFKRIEDMARRDGLTGFLTHTSIHDELAREVQRALEDSTQLTLVMSDVDHFKQFNDFFGHQAGDHVLREVARVWRAIMPEHAILGRYGGEEFICVLPREDLERGRDLAEAVREHLESYAFDFAGQELKVTASFGIAELGRPAVTDTELIRLADRALYRAKDTGRNRVVCSPLHALPDSARFSGNSIES